jgi:hypothetical protein
MFQKKCLLFFLFFLICEITFSQESLLAEKIGNTALLADTFLGFDNQQNQYSIKDNVLSKINKDINYQYNNVSLGKISHVDFQNPLQILVFYNDFNTAVLLDNQLNETKKIDFNLLSESVNIDAVALSSQNQLWFFDSISSKIGLYNLSNDSFKWISTTLEHPIKHYHSNYTHFYWLNDKNKFYSISIYGTIETFDCFPEFDTIQLINSEIALYSNNNQLLYYEIANNRSTKIKIDENFVTNFFFADGILAIFTQNEITNYKIILP